MRGTKSTEIDWAEVAQHDASLRRFVDAEVARAGVDASAWRAEAEHWKTVAVSQRARLSATLTSEAQHREGDRVRKMAFRRRGLQ